MLCDSKNFYPRPPRGGRRCLRPVQSSLLHISIHALREEGDQDVCSASGGTAISIHALREEGDPEPPDSGRASTISIHALREEGDSPSGRSSGPHPISIHALREEGDDALLGTVAALNNFYPRPPRGGRLVPPRASFSNSFYFYPRPPRGGRPSPRSNHGKQNMISIHALREEGDIRRHDGGKLSMEFLSTPSARRATRVLAVGVSLFH